MIWLKSVLAGFTAAILTVIAIVLVTLRVFVDGGYGTGGVVAASFGISTLAIVPVALAFALAFRWMLRRQRRRA